MAAPLISKSKYLWGLQCRKLLWYAYHRKDAFPETGAALQAIFDQGHEVGRLAKTLFPGGIEIAPGIVDIPTVSTLTYEAVRKRKPLFEAGFTVGRVYARTDILNPTGRTAWDLIEVKSSTEAKEVHLDDLALQRYVLEGAGMEIRHTVLMHINNRYVRKGDIDPRSIFTRVDVTREVAERLAQVEPALEEMARTIDAGREPAIAIGPHCSDPYDCPLRDRCWQHLPEQNVFVLQRIGAKGFDLLAQGILHARDIPVSVPLSKLQSTQLEVIRSGEPRVEKDQIRTFLGLLKYPLFFLDFETFNTAIPLFDLVRPYEQVPFQYSLHVVSHPGAAPRHVSCLANGREDPRPLILGQLRELLGSKGSIVAYNAGFEKMVMRACTDTFPAYRAWWSGTEKRVVDLLTPFRAFHYYHPDQLGSVSIKRVMPVLTGTGYDDLVIGDGGTASQEFLRVTYGKAAEKERLLVRNALEAYCATDTRGMVDIVTALRKLVAAPR